MAPLRRLNAVAGIYLHLPAVAGPVPRRWESDECPTQELHDVSLGLTPRFCLGTRSVCHSMVRRTERLLLPARVGSRHLLLLPPQRGLYLGLVLFSPGKGALAGGPHQGRHCCASEYTHDLLLNR